MKFAIAVWLYVSCSIFANAQAPRYAGGIGYAVGKPTFDSLKVAINGFYLSKDSSSTENRFWLKSDFSLFHNPFAYLLPAYHRENFEYLPFITNITPVKPYSDYLIYVSYLSTDSLGPYIPIPGMFYIGATKDSSGNYMLKYPTDLLTLNWKKYQVGNGTFIVNPQKTYNPDQAGRMDSFNTFLGQYFRLPVEKFIYYSCGNVHEFEKLQGVDYYYMSGNFDSLTAGKRYYMLSEARIYSGNNSEYYPHELVHVYSEKLVDSPRYGGYFLSSEGVSTWLGGSEEKSLDFHLKTISNYAAANGITKIARLLEVRNTAEIKSDIFYGIGGLIAKLTDQKQGYKGIAKLMNTSDKDMFAFVAKLYGIPEKEVDSFLMKELHKYR
jgi:hypothetical protein